MFCLWFRRFKWACKNTDLCIMDFFCHLRMREILINYYSVNKGSVFKTSSCLSYDFNVFKINIFSVKISYLQYCLYCDISHMFLAPTHNFRSQSSYSAFLQELILILLDINFLLDFFNLFDSNVTTFFKSISNFQRMYSFV